MALKVVLVHPYLRVLGGGERVCFYAIRSLLEYGCDVTLISQKLEEEHIEAVSGFNRFGEITHVPYPDFEPRMSRFRVYQRMLHHLLARRKFKGLRFDVKFLTQDVGFNMCRSDACIAYIHYPEFFAHLEQSPDSILWRGYYWPLHRHWMRQASEVNVFLANSRYTQDKIKRRWGKRSEVVYPPVETRLFKPSERRRGRIVSVGRITPSKRYQTVLEVARELPDLEFIICGLKQDESYFRKLMEGRPRNVHIKTDITFDSLRKELAASKVYLHCMREEHFGISIVEAMAAGCVPVVHDSGGPREIVTPECGFRFTSLTEAVEMISTVIEEAEVFSRLSLNARKRAEEYDVENFNRSIISALQSVTGKRDIT